MFYDYDYDYDYKKPRSKTPNWMMNRDNRYSYQNVKEMARSRRTWTDWCTEPALGTEPKEVTSL